MKKNQRIEIYFRLCQLLHKKIVEQDNTVAVTHSLGSPIEVYDCSKGKYVYIPVKGQTIIIELNGGAK